MPNTMTAAANCFQYLLVGSPQFLVFPEEFFFCLLPSRDVPAHNLVFCGIAIRAKERTYRQGLPEFLPATSEQRPLHLTDRSIPGE